MKVDEDNLFGICDGGGWSKVTGLDEKMKALKATVIEVEIRQI